MGVGTYICSVVAEQAGSLFNQVLANSAGRPIFTADYYSVDPVSGKVLAFIDHNDPTHLLQQTDNTKQVSIPTTSAALNGAVAASFTGTQYYTSNRAPSEWQFVWSNTVSHYMAFVPTGGLGQLYLSCGDGAGNTNNFAYYTSNPAGTTLLSSICRATGGYQQLSRNCLSVGNGVLLESSVDNAALTRYFDASNVASTSGVLTGTGGAASIGGVLAGLGDGSYNAYMSWHSLIFQANTTSRALVSAWLLKETGIVL